MLSSEDRAEVIRLYTEELIPMVEIAKRYCVSRQAIYKLIRRAGIDILAASKINTVCRHCGCPVTKARCQFRNTNSVFCSRQCYYSWLRSGNAYIEDRTGSRQSRKIVAAVFNLQPGNIVHHIDGNQANNNLDNLIVFKNQGDHVRHHRGITVPILWP
jgi:hypothetical protein